MECLFFFRYFEQIKKTRYGTSTKQTQLKTSLRKPYIYNTKTTPIT